ncbi:uncharacterized protein LOC143239460 [Tachypleus tridentatus]|uniref:uncharacterized protein LOC143239460 n=1 Tax=Tachypleus tridentatus TaxID=6853 RepID=UPI003FCF0353
MGCNVSKDVKVEGQRNGNTIDGARQKSYGIKGNSNFKDIRRKEKKDSHANLPGLVPVECREIRSQISPEEARAASKIQASFRGYKVRKELKTMKTEETKPHIKEELFEIDSNDTDLTKAVTKIQASFRGFKARKDLKTHEKVNKAPGWIQEQPVNEMDLSDPNLLKAVTKIQATFRGYHTRKRVGDLNMDGE